MSSMTYRSPLLDLPGAVAAEAPDTGVAAHYGSFNVEQRQLVADEGFVVGEGMIKLLSNTV